jgi:hypothetical protein
LAKEEAAYLLYLDFQNPLTTMQNSKGNFLYRQRTASADSPPLHAEILFFAMSVFGITPLGSLS